MPIIPITNISTPRTAGLSSGLTLLLATLAWLLAAALLLWGWTRLMS